jgi:PAS domain S-box-containing protein
MLFAVTIRDVTKRRDREERLREAEAKYRTLVEQLPLATYINETGLPVRTRYISPQIEAMMGFPVADWLQEGFFEQRLHPDDRERVLEALERTHETGEDFRMEYRLVAANGHVVWVLDETVAVRDEEYRPLFLQGFLIDVSDRREVDDALRHSEELHKLVVEHSRDMIAVVDADGRTLFVSPAVRDLLGYEPVELIGTSWSDTVHPEDSLAVAAYFMNRAAGLEVPPMSARTRHKDGSWVTLEGSVSVMTDANSGSTQFVCVCHAVAQHGALRPAAS